MIQLGDLFNIEYGHKLDMNKMTEASPATGIAFVGRKGGYGGHCGVSGYVREEDGLVPYTAGRLTVALGGSRLLSTYVQQRPFYTAQNVAVLTPKDELMTTKHRLYYAMCIRHNAFRYSAFGREANRTLTTIEVPSVVPDWVDGMKIPTPAGLSKAAGPEQQLGKPTAWPKHKLEDLFTIKKGRRLTKASRSSGGTRFIGASEKNNGITDLTSEEPNFDVPCLTVPYNGSVGWAFYQDEPFFASDDVNVLLPKLEMSMWSLLFVATVIRHERGRYTYGYKWTLARMKKTMIRLPTRKSGEPDLDFMESFVRGLRFSKAIDR